MPKTLATLTLTVLLLSSTLGVAAPRDWNALLFDGAPAGGVLPADPVQAAATCAEVYGELWAYHSVFGPPEDAGMFQVRTRAAQKALRALVGNSETAAELVEAAGERLEFLPGGAWRHIRARFTEYDAACTALLAPRYRTQKE